jgi:methyl-accepting chemotaxis protein
MSTANTTTHPPTGVGLASSLRVKLGAVWLVMAAVPVGVWWAATTGTGGLGVALGGVVVELAGAAVVYYLVVGDLYRLHDLAHAARNGEYDRPVRTDRSDVVGHIFEDVAAFRDELADYAADVEATNRRMNAAVMDQAAVMSACADGDLTRRMDTDTGVPQLDMVAEEFNGMADGLEGLLADVDRFSDGIVAVGDRLDEELDRGETAARTVEERLGRIDEATTRQRDDLAEAAGTLQELSDGLESVADRTDDLADSFGRTATRAEEGREATREAIDAVETIRTRAEAAGETVGELTEIRADITSLVEYIAQVTRRADMLATKADVAASKGGGQGGELAALAGEMGDFAEETRTATKRIQRRLAELERVAAAAVEDLEATSETVERGSGTVERALAEFREVAAAVEGADETVRAVSQQTDRGAETARAARSRVEEVAETSRRTAAVSGEIATASSEQLDALGGAWEGVRRLTDQATALSDRLTRFETRPEAGRTAPGGDQR